jgi:signal transduction histidine kinase
MVDVSRSGVVSNLRSNYFGMEEQITEEDLLQIVAASLNAEENTGILKGEGLRYYRKASYDGWRIVYLDTGMEESTLSSLLRNILLITTGSFVGIFFLSMGLAWWITKPVERAWNQQRQFVADASHELKTPLTVILSNTDMLLHREFADEQSKRRLGNIREESIGMKSLVEDMLYLARSDSGVQQKQLELVNFSDVVMDSVLMFEPLAFEKQKELQYQLESGLSVMGSLNKMKQLVEILLDNAMKYSDENGHIWVKLEKQNGKNLRLMVANTGETMTAEQCRRIFERFYRTDPARQNNGGYGLGLAIASSIVKEMDGKIWCESQNGVCSFYVQLPLCRENKENSEFSLEE